jgi:plasmid stability protein
MASLTLKAVPQDLHAQLKSEAAASFRSLDQEAIARIQRSFELEERHSAPAVERLINEAVASGPEEPLMRTKFDAARRRTRAMFASKRKAA